MPNPNPRRGPYSVEGSRAAGRQRRRLSKEESVVHYLGDGKQGAEQVAFIQQLLNSSNPSLLKKIAKLLDKRQARADALTSMLKTRGGIDLASFRKA